MLVIWNSSKHRFDVAIYFLTMLLINVCVVCGVVAPLIQGEVIISLLFLGVVCVVQWNPYKKIKMAYKYLTFKGSISLILCRHEDIIERRCEADSSNIVFSDNHGIVFCKSEDEYEMLNRIYQFRTYENFLFRLDEN